MKENKQHFWYIMFFFLKVKEMQYENLIWHLKEFCAFMNGFRKVIIVVVFIFYNGH